MPDVVQPIPPPSVQGPKGDSADSSTRNADARRTDVANGERLAQDHGADLRYCHPWRKWHVWDKRRWKPDDTGAVHSRAKATARRIYAEAGRCEDEGQAKRLARWAGTSHSAPRIEAMVKLAQSEPGIPILPDALDRDPWLLNCRSGTIDLRSGQARSHQRGDYITKLAPAEIDSSAECPLWDAFLKRVLPEPEVRSFVQKAVGYSLTGSVREQVLFFCWGGGANGKTVFLNTLQHLLGRDFAIQAAPELLLGKGANQHPTELADLAGVRVAICTEIDLGRRFGEALIKQLTGGDPIRARRMREDFWQFDPTHKIWVAANHKPGIRGTDHGIWRRIRLIPFNVTLPEGERDPDLGHKLAKERSGILNWALEGCRLWQRDGLEAPPQVLQATEEYRQEMDIIGLFLSERCEEKSGANVSATELYKAYKSWCEESGERPQSQRTFGSQMTERGVPRVKRGGRMVYVGIGLTASSGRIEGRRGPCGPESGFNALSSSSLRGEPEIRSRSSPSSPNGGLEVPEEVGTWRY